MASCAWSISHHNYVKSDTNHCARLVIIPRGWFTVLLGVPSLTYIIFRSVINCWRTILKESLTSNLREEAWDNLQRLFSSIISDESDSDDDSDLEDDIYDKEEEHEEEEEEEDYESTAMEYVINDELDKEPLVAELSTYATSIINNLARKDARNLRADFESMVSLCEELDIHHEDVFEEIESYLDILNVSEGKLIYLPKHDSIYTPQLILAVHSDLIKLIARQPNLIFEISPRKFEEIIAELFFKKGFEVELTKQTRDGGRDIIAISKEMDVRTKYLIECKRYAMTRNISIGVVQRLLGVKVAESANKAILATTSGFTKDARKFANSHLWDLDLKDHKDIMTWIRTYD